MKHGEKSSAKPEVRNQKSDLRHSTSDFSTRALALCAALPLIAATLDLAGAATAGSNPYSGIVERNAFGLKPPVNPADLVKLPPPVTADIKLQGITTILGRKQVLIKVKMPARPPEPAREESFVLSEGQREGEVEVLEINPMDGTVRVNNGGTILSLNLKDHGEKPVPGAAVLVAGSPPQPGGIPGVPSPVQPAAALMPPGTAGSAGRGATTFGGSTAQNVSAFGSTAGAAGATANGNPQQKNIPSRTLRSSAANSGASTGGEFQNLSPEAQAILIEAQRATIPAGGNDPLPKTAITPRPQPQQQQ